MFRNQLFLGIFALLLVIPLASNSEVKLWDLQIQASVENSPIFSVEVNGKVLLFTVENGQIIQIKDS